MRPSHTEQGRVVEMRHYSPLPHVIKSPSNTENNRLVDSIYCMHIEPELQQGLADYQPLMHH